MTEIGSLGLRVVVVIVVVSHGRRTIIETTLVGRESVFNVIVSGNNWCIEWKRDFCPCHHFQITNYLGLVDDRVVCCIYTQNMCTERVVEPTVLTVLTSCVSAIRSRVARSVTIA